MTLQNFGADTFQSGGRGSPNAWSPASDTQTWTQALGTATLSIIADGGLNRGKLLAATDTNPVVMYLGSTSFSDLDMTCRVLASNTGARLSIIGRSTATNTYYRASVNGTGAGNFEIFKDNAGAGTQLGNASVTFAANTYYWIRFRIQGYGDNPNDANNLKAKYWADGTSQPGSWTISVADSTLTNPGQFGLQFKAANTNQYGYFDNFTCTDMDGPIVTSPTNTTTGDRPYGVTNYIPNTNTPPLPAQTVTDMAGWFNGAWLRWNQRWKDIETVQGLYDWAILDDAIEKANYNGFRFMLPVQAPPTWAITRDSLGSNATLTAATQGSGAAYSLANMPSGGYTKINVTALPDGAYIPHLSQLSLDYGSGITPQATAETVYVWLPGNTYTSGTTTIGISTSKTSQVGWTPSSSHSAGAVVWEAKNGPQFGSSVEYTTFCTLLATRYSGQAGSYGKLDAIQIENEAYDTGARIGGQGSYGAGGGSPASWDKSSTWDNGGAILAPVYSACRAAIHAVTGMSTCPVFPCAVRKAPTTGRQHVINWMTGLVKSVLALGGTIDGADAHYYRDGTTDWDGTLKTDPTTTTYQDSSHMTVNAPSIALELQDIKAVFASNGLPNAKVMIGETGWPVYDDGAGPIAKLSAAVNSGTAYKTLAVTGPWFANAAAIPDATPITVDYTNVGTSEIVYAYGQTTKNATIIQITTNSGGKAGGAQAAWTPANTHAATTTQVYAATTTRVVSVDTQSSYLKSMYDAMRTGGGAYCFVYTMNAITNVVTTTVNPQKAQSIDNLTHSIGGVYTYHPAYGMTVVDSSIYPTWTGHGGGGGGGGGGGTPSPTYQVLINNSSVFVEAGTLQADQAIGQRSQANFVVHTDSGTHFQQDQPVQIIDPNGTLVYSGYITAPKEQKPGFKPSLEHTIPCADQHRLADKRVVVGTYIGKSPTFIVQDMLNQVLTSEGVTIGKMYDGPLPSTTLFPSTTLYPDGADALIPNATFVYCTAAQALDELVKNTSTGGVPYYWQIDQNKQLWFVPYTAIINSATIDGTLIDLVYQPPSVTRANPTYRNTQYVVGGVATTIPQNENFPGNGNQTTFTLRYDVNAAPSIKVNATPHSVGIRGIDTNKDWYWQQGSSDITQDSSGTPLTSDDNLNVVYIGQFPSVAYSQSLAQVNAEAALDGTTGIVEQVEQDDTVSSAATGLAKASNLLSRYAQQGTTLVFNTQQTGFAPGQLVTINLPVHNLNNVQMLIESMSISDHLDALNMWFTVSCVLGPYDLSWVQFFGKMFATSQPSNAINVGISSTLNRIAPFVTSITVVGALKVNVFACPLPGASLFPSGSLFPC